MVGRITSALNIKSDEAQQILTLFGASFFLGGALVFFYTASNSIFLTEFDADTLPYVYIVNAVFVILFGMLYNWLEKRLSLIGLLTSSLAVLTVSIAIFWLSFQSDSEMWIW